MPTTLFPLMHTTLPFSKEVTTVFQLLFFLSTTLGLLRLFKALIALSLWVWATFVMPMKDLKHYGSWAIVTGPTDGIGKSIAFHLARLGQNIVLVGRNPVKLNSVASEIQKNFESVKVRSIVVDFSRDVDEGMIRIKEGIKDLDVGILINNAGTSYPYSRFLHEADVEQIESIIRVNLETVTRLTHVVLPVMMKKRRGAILNLGSAAGSLLPSYPLGAIYGATKAYIDHFSKSLRVEYKRFGIDVQCQAPFYVATKMTDLKPSLFVPSADECAEWCLHRIGNHESVCSPYWSHSIQWFGMWLLPDGLLNRLILRVMLRRREKGRMKENIKGHN